MTVETNGRGAAVRFSLPTLGAISSIASVVVFITGFAFGYLSFKAEMGLIGSSQEDLRRQASSIGLRLNTLTDSVNGDRQALTNRLTALETKLEFIRQDTADIKLKTSTNRP